MDDLSVRYGLSSVAGSALSISNSAIRQSSQLEQGDAESFNVPARPSPKEDQTLHN